MKVMNSLDLAAFLEAGFGHNRNFVRHRDAWHILIVIGFCLKVRIYCTRAALRTLF